LCEVVKALGLDLLHVLFVSPLFLRFRLADAPCALLLIDVGGVGVGGWVGVKGMGVRTKEEREGLRKKARIPSLVDV
jgi:hypothetical protein